MEFDNAIHRGSNRFKSRQGNTRTWTLPRCVIWFDVFFCCHNIWLSESFDPTKGSYSTIIDIFDDHFGMLSNFAMTCSVHLFMFTFRGSRDANVFRVSKFQYQSLRWSKARRCSHKLRRVTFSSTLHRHRITSACECLQN
jgi:hypothetical protein